MSLVDFAVNIALTIDQGTRKAIKQQAPRTSTSRVHLILSKYLYSYFVESDIFAHTR